MARQDYSDLVAFLAVARERSFTRAAAKLGVSPSALSHAVRALEERTGMRLLTRTTRSVAPTQAGERLSRGAGPRFDEIDAEVAGLAALRDSAAGSLRISASDHGANSVLWPALERLLPLHPDICVEVVVDNALTDIVAGRFDAGVRIGEQVAKDMIAVRIGPDFRMAVVGAPSYFAKRPPPARPQDLTAHACINLRLPTHGGLYVWEFEKAGRPVKVRVEGQLVLNTSALRLRAALAGLGLACLPEDIVGADVAAGRLVRVLADWCAPFPGYHLYYPSRRQQTPALAVLIEALRHRPERRPAAKGARATAR